MSQPDKIQALVSEAPPAVSALEVALNKVIKLRAENLRLKKALEKCKEFMSEAQIQEVEKCLKS